MTSNNAYDILQERGFIAQVTDEAAVRKMLAGRAITFYVGFDGTADSMHAGHLVPVMAMMHLQRAGHRPIGLVGGGTTMVGDPSGKTEMRQMLMEETIEANAQKIHAQLNHYLHFDEGRAIPENNAHWLLDLKYIPFLREIGRHFSVNRMLAAEAYKVRYERGLSFIEFNYQLLQAYDFLELYRRYGCTMQMGGDDQWSNLLAGVDLIRRVEGATVEAMTYHLLTTASGAKMGKTAAGAVWLDPHKLAPYDYYQYWINCDDRDVEKLLKIFTFLPLDEIKRLAALEGAELREAKRVLAFEATKITHGESEAHAAEEAARAAFAQGGDMSAMPTTTLDFARLERGLGVLEIFSEVGLTQSRGEARRMVQQGGLYVNDQRIDEVEAVLTPANLTPAGILLRAGKKKYHRLVVEE
ncbi:MAG: tyrosine--tRNA ligase [Anaerolineae bacterium]|nr:tyrosine--tRNA ligase [Anaerolineales bacterium]MCQ3976087.1 tyrosine--tRNA ligase [Anaerolineae bacterium]